MPAATAKLAAIRTGVQTRLSVRKRHNRSVNSAVDTPNVSGCVLRTRNDGARAVDETGDPAGGQMLLAQNLGLALGEHADGQVVDDCAVEHDGHVDTHHRAARQAAN